MVLLCANADMRCAKMLHWVHPLDFLCTNLYQSDIEYFG
ncbi:hypothetical protein GPLA_1279 [Paraglaciecola polaris LMG 21857]|uniref:Uncharacterized protein n=1 Tax=Paraglaciecola polaris LMG 21857 TaxID=1129793 RepID=K6YHI3_9ALTE|nr:hypothetical protein GPLA_1279 [Paraglaciecola polaris LMG 21857]